MADNINQPTKGDIAHSVAKGALGAIPLVGSLATEIFNLIITPPLEKRRAEWMNELAEELKKLEAEKGINIEDLKDNDQFIDVMLQATSYVLKTSEKEKITAFKNAILNTAINEAPEATLSQIYLNQLDRFTTWHIKVLHFIDDPIYYYRNTNRNTPNLMMGSISMVIKDIFPELKNQSDLLELIWNDLESVGFHKTPGINTTMSGTGLLQERTTSLGKGFIEFISNKE